MNDEELEDYYKLSVRALKAICNASNLNRPNRDTKASVRELLVNGRLSRKMLNVGPKTIKELRLYAGLPIDPEKPKQTRRCPHCGKPI